MANWLKKELDKQERIRNERYASEPVFLQIARHEVAHAVMRKIVSLPATRVTLHEDGGLCEGTGTRIKAYQAVLVSLAGLAWESLSGIAPPVHQINFEETRHTFEDVGQAWQLLERGEYLRIHAIIGKNGECNMEIECVEKAIGRWYSRTMKELEPHSGLILATGKTLHEAGELSASQTAALLRGVSRGLGPP